MIEKEHNGIRWLEFELLADCPIVHGCLMRHGGVSTGILESLNLGRHVGDKPENVDTNFNRVRKALSLDKIASAKICHGADVTQINDARTPLSDGLTTSVPGLAISVSQADCQAAIFYDPVRHVLANVHSGWRSSVQNIYQVTVDAMKALYGSSPSDLLVCVSPSLGPENSEFINYRQELPEPLWEFEVKPNHFDFWAISERQLQNAGVLPNHIQVARVDTRASDDFFSFRRSRLSGRQATIAMLR